MDVLLALRIPQQAGPATAKPVESDLVPAYGSGRHGLETFAKKSCPFAATARMSPIKIAAMYARPA